LNGLKSIKLMAISTLAGIGVLGISVPAARAFDLICMGVIPDARLSFTVPHSPESGFMQQVEFRNVMTGAGVAKSDHLTFDRNNEQGQGIFRGSVRGMADVTLIDMAEFQPEPGSEISVGYDGQWGRGTCAPYDR